MTLNVTRHKLPSVSADNRGAQALRTLLDTTSQVDLAKKTGISQSHLSRLSRGDTLPKMREQALVLAAEGIAVEWWDEPPLPAPAPSAEPAKDEEPAA